MITDEVQQNIDKFTEYLQDSGAATALIVVGYPNQESKSMDLYGNGSDLVDTGEANNLSLMEIVHGLQLLHGADAEKAHAVIFAAWETIEAEMITFIKAHKESMN